MARPTLYNSEYHDNWAWSLTIKGAIDKDIATAFNITERTLNRWKNTHHSFAEKLNTGKEAADANVERSLYKRALGYTFDEIEKNIDVDADGKPIVTKTKIVTKHIPADTMAMMYWLNNRSKSNWTRTPEGATNDDIIEKLDNVLGTIKGVF